MRGSRDARITGLAVAAALLATAGAYAAAPSEAELQAAFVLRLTRFVTWPEGVLGDELRIAVVDASAIHAALVEMARGQSSGDRPLVVQAGWDGSDPPAVVFLGDAAVESGLARLEGEPTLTLAGVRGFARRGGMVELVREGARIHLEIGLAAVQRAGLQISSRVLDLARAIHE
jgi:hypothetical protein